MVKKKKKTFTTYREASHITSPNIPCPFQGPPHPFLYVYFYHVYNLHVSLSLRFNVHLGDVINNKNWSSFILHIILSYLGTSYYKDFRFAKVYSENPAINQLTINVQVDFWACLCAVLCVLLWSHHYTLLTEELYCILKYSCWLVPVYCYCHLSSVF